MVLCRCREIWLREMNWYFGDQQEKMTQVARSFSPGEVEKLRGAGDGTEMGRLGDASPHYAPGCAWRGCRVSTIPGEKPYVAETVVKGEGGERNHLSAERCKALQLPHLCNQINNPPNTCHSMSRTHQNIDIHSYLPHASRVNTLWGETRFTIDIIHIQLPPPTSIM